LTLEQLYTAEDPAHLIRAELLRELLLSRRGALDPRGVRVSGARIVGTLDLDYVHASVGLHLNQCVIEGPVGLRDAHLPRLQLSGIRAAGLHGDGLQVDNDVYLDKGFSVDVDGAGGEVRLLGARIGGDLGMSGAVLVNKIGPALAADGLRVDNNVYLDKGFSVDADSVGGAVRLSDARIGGQLFMSGAQLVGKIGPALAADRLQVDNNVYLDEGFNATGESDRGAVLLSGARIGGHLAIRNVKLVNKTGPALQADGLQVDSDVFLDEGFNATGESDRGAVRLIGGRIGGQLGMHGAQLVSKTGVALNAERLQVDSDVFLVAGFSAAGEGDGGAVRLMSAHIHGQLLMGKAELVNKTGPALQADGLQVDSDVFLDEGFSAAGEGDGCAVRLTGGRIGGELVMSGAQLVNKTGSALQVEGLQVNGNVYLDAGFSATGDGDRGAVRLMSARIGGDLSVSGAKLSNPCGLLLDLEAVGLSTLLLPSTVICPAGATGDSRCKHADRRIGLDQLTYASLIGISWKQWLHLIRCHTAGYGPMPYQRLAAVQKAAGHDGDAREILIAQQRDLRARGDLGGWFAQLIHLLWGALAGYGYRARRTAFALLIALVLAGGLGWWAGHTVTTPGHHVAGHTSASGVAGTPCSTLEQVGVGIDRGLPLAATGIRARCDLDTGSTAGEWFTLGIWILQAIIWAFATLAIAGYTGLIRKIT
jgi:hypothetical protein